MSFAFGLAVLGGALSVGLRSYLTTATRQERDIRATIALESAAADVLGRLAAGGQGASPNPKSGPVEVTLELSRPNAKVDLAADAGSLVRQTLDSDGLIDAGAPLPALDGGLAKASRVLGLNARQEDCLRRHATFGRAPAARVEGPAAGLPVGPAIAGDQIDVRASLKDGDRDEVLWLRVRFTGRETGWLVHDYRRLSGTATCSRPVS